MIESEIKKAIKKTEEKTKEEEEKILLENEALKVENKKFKIELDNLKNDKLFLEKRINDFEIENKKSLLKKLNFDQVKKDKDYYRNMVLKLRDQLI